MSKEQIVNEIHRPARKNFVRRHVIQKGILDTWQIDLVEMIPYSKLNKGYKYILTVIDIFTKIAYAMPVKDKSAIKVMEAMQTIFKTNKNKVPTNIHSDQGSEFFNKHFKQLMVKYKINHYHTFSNLKASIVERFNRTLKTKMWKLFSLNGNYKWLDLLSNLVKQYNATFHRTIQMAPCDVKSKSVEKQLLETVYNNINKNKTTRKPKFIVGEYVRISKYKGIFDKGYNPNWSTEVFVINNVQTTNPITYILKDLQDTIIKGCFYEQELQKTHLKESYLVEKVINKKNNKVYVKWLGFDNSHNSWINKSDILK